MNWRRRILGMHEHEWVTVAVWNKRPNHNDFEGKQWDGAMMEMCRHCAVPKYFLKQYDSTYNGEPAELFSLMDDSWESIGRWVTRLEMVAEFKRVGRQ